MTEAEIDALARQLLTDSVTEINSWDPSFFFEVYNMEEEGLVPVYGGQSEEGHGALVCEFMALATIKTLIVKCGQLYDGLQGGLVDQVSNAEDKEALDKLLTKGRERAIKGIARTAALELIGSFYTKLGDTLEEAIEDARMMAYAHLGTSLALQINEIVPGAVTIDTRKQIEDAALRVAEKKRTMLRNHMKDLPHMLTSRGRGAPPKSESTREIERQTYLSRIEEAYRKLHSEKGRSPTKTEVAKELRSGGVSIRTGIDSTLPAFRNRLIRLGLDYDSIKVRLDNELNKNS